MSKHSRRLFTLLCFVLLCQVVAAENNDTVDFRPGVSIKSIIDRLRHQGYPIAYSSDHLPESLVITVTPIFDDPIEAVRQILIPHGLQIREFNNLLIIGKSTTDPQTAVTGAVELSIIDARTNAPIDKASIENLPDSVKLTRLGSSGFLLTGPEGQWPVRVNRPGYTVKSEIINLKAEKMRRLTISLTEAVAPIPEIIVFASHYEFNRDSSVSVSKLDQQALNESPDLGNDPMRAIQRLPGVASDGASARSFVRGGTEQESGIVLDGHRLLDPFHVRDYQSLFSAIDVRAVSAMDVFTGGFPVKYGNLNSSLVLVDSIDPDIPLQTELGLSIFNTSVLSAGNISDGDAHWVFSGRRGNLDLIIDKDLGEPSYFDVFGKLSVDFSPTTTITANGIVIVDQVDIVTAADVDEREEATNETRNTQFWISWGEQWDSKLKSNTRLSFSDFSSDRKAIVDDPEKIIGNIIDIRDVQVVQLNQDWEWNSVDAHILAFGGEFKSLTSSYDYQSTVNYFGFFQGLSGLPDFRNRNYLLDIDGDAFSVYASDRWQFADRWTADIGFRWDKQNYTDLDDNGQFSPRVGLLFDYTDKTLVRLSWGRYYQAQQIQELQVEDGVSQFFDAQRTDQWVFGIDHQLTDQIALRAEAFSKSYTQMRPRYENLFDSLTIFPELEADRVRIAPDKARAKGVELSVVYSDDEHLSWWANYVLSHARDRIEGRFVDRSWDQRHALQTGLAWTGHRWSYSAAANWHSGWPKTDVFLDSTSDPQSPVVLFGARNAERYGSFMTVDMRIEYERPIRKGSLSWFFEVSNSTNRRNPCCVDYDLDEDENGNFLLDKNDEYWFPLLPATGVLWKF